MPLRRFEAPFLFCDFIESRGRLSNFPRSFASYLEQERRSDFVVSINGDSNVLVSPRLIFSFGS